MKDFALFNNTSIHKHSIEVKSDRRLNERFHGNNFYALFADENFNCSFRNHRCGWQDDKFSLKMKPEYNQGTCVRLSNFPY